MASRTTTRVAGFFARLACQLRAFPDLLITPSNRSTLIEFASSRRCCASPGANLGYSGVGEIFGGRHLTSFGGSGFSNAEFAVVPFWKRDFTSRLLGTGRQNELQFGVGQVRTIMVEVKGNDLDRAIRKWKRKCKEENLKILKDREYFKKPSEKRVLALKERDRRIARRSFKMKLNWILNRRQRGF